MVQSFVDSLYYALPVVEIISKHNSLVDKDFRATENRVANSCLMKLCCVHSR